MGVEHKTENITKSTRDGNRWEPHPLGQKHQWEGLGVSGCKGPAVALPAWALRTETHRGSHPARGSCEVPEPSPPAVSQPGSQVASPPFLHSVLLADPVQSPPFPHSGAEGQAYGSSAPSPSLPEGCVVPSPARPAPPVLRNLTRPNSQQ